MAKFHREIFAAIAGSVGFVSSSMAYGWLSPVIGQLTESDGEFRLDRSQVTNVALLIEAGCLVSSLAAAAMMDRAGRKRSMLAAAPLFAAAWALALATRSTPAIYAKRVLEGLGLGILFSVGPVYLAEIASPQIRGAVLLSISVSWYVGMFAQYCVGTYLSYDSSAAINLCLPLLTLATLWPLPESPYHLLACGRRTQAASALAWYRHTTPEMVAAELSEMQRYLDEELRERLPLRAVLSDQIYRRCFAVMGAVVVGTILTGVTAVYAFSSEIFANTFDQDVSSLLIAALFLVVTILSCTVVDRVGRRPLLVLTSLGCCLSNAATALYFYVPPASLTWVPLLTIGAYCFFVSLGLAPIMIVLQGELFPAGVKALGASLTQAFITVCSLLVLQLHEVVRSLWGVHTNYVLYSVIGAICTVYLYLYAPETKNKTFAEIFQTQRIEAKASELETVHSTMTGEDGEGDSGRMVDVDR